MSWSSWLRVALDPAAPLDQIAGHGATELRSSRPGRAGVAFAVAYVAERLGRAPTAVAYDAERLRALADLPPRLRYLLPTAAQLRLAAGSWDEALASAGISAQAVPAADGGVPALAVLEAYADAHDAWPTKRALEAFGAALGVRWRRPHQDEMTLAEAIRRAASLRAERGLPTPSPESPRSNAASAPLAARERLASAPEAVVYWERAAVVAAIAGWLNTRTGRSTTWRAYVADAAGDDNLPMGRTITRFGGWGRLREEAQITAQGSTELSISSQRNGACQEASAASDVLSSRTSL